LTPEEFKRQLNELRWVIFRGLLFLSVWKALLVDEEGVASLSLTERNGLLNRYKGFFAPVVDALREGALIQFAKVYDTHPKAISLKKLLAAARREASLAPNATVNELRQIANLFGRAQSVIDNLLKIRNERLAHLDQTPEEIRLMLPELENLVEVIKEAFNKLSLAHDNSIYGWEDPQANPARHTTQILTILAEAERKRLNARPVQ